MHEGSYTLMPYEIEIEADRDASGRFAHGNKAAIGHGRPKNLLSMPKLLEERMSRLEVAEEIVHHARAGEAWALKWIADRYWPKSAKLELAGEVEIRADYHGPFRGTFLSTREALREVSEEAVDY